MSPHKNLAMALKAGLSLIDLVPILNWREPRRWLRPYHLRCVADVLQKSMHEEQRVCISVPPRHSKTELMIAAIVYWWLLDPTQQIVYISHTDRFAQGRMARAADLALHAGIQPGSVWRLDEYNTAQGGKLFVRSVGGNITGDGFDKMIIDDPCKDRAAAESPTMREKGWEWLTGTAMTRTAAGTLRPPGGSVFVQHTRWHDHDLIGRLSKQNTDKWKILNLPAICTDPVRDLAGRKMNDALWPEVWPADKLEEKRLTEVFEYEWEAQYMGQPVPKGSRVFKQPAYYTFPNFDSCRFVIGCDPAAGGHDYSAIVVLAVRGIGRQTTVDIVDVWRERISVPDLCRMLRQVQEKWRCEIVVEAAGAFKCIPQMLWDIDPSLRIIPVTPIGSKFHRAQPIASAWNDAPGRVRVPSDNPPWLRPFLDEVLTFTGTKDAYDDQVDAMSHAFNTAIEIYQPLEIGSQESLAAY